MPRSKGTVKKAAGKKTAAAKTAKYNAAIDFTQPAQDANWEEIKNSQKSAPRSLFKIILIIVIFFLLGTFIYKNKSYFIVASINNVPISSLTLYSEMKKQTGKQILDRVIIEKLITQEAAKRGIKVEDAEITKEVEKIKQSFTQGLTLESVLAQQGLTIDDVHKDITIRLLATKMVEDKIQVTDEEINEYIKQTTTLAQSGSPPPTQEEVKNNLKEQKTNEELQNLINELKTQAKINIFI